MALNTGYLSSNRGVAKILQVILGFIICSLVCVNWYSGRNCLSDWRLAYAFTLSLIIVIVNVAIFLLNFLNLGLPKVECFYSFVCSFLFLVAAIIIGWFIVERDMHKGFLIAATVLLLLESVLFILDIKIIRGEISDE